MIDVPRANKGCIPKAVIVADSLSPGSTPKVRDLKDVDKYKELTRAHIGISVCHCRVKNMVTDLYPLSTIDNKEKRQRERARIYELLVKKTKRKLVFLCWKPKFDILQPVKASDNGNAFAKTVVSIVEPCSKHYQKLVACKTLYEPTN